MAPRIWDSKHPLPTVVTRPPLPRRRSTAFTRLLVATTIFFTFFLVQDNYIFRGDIIPGFGLPHLSWPNINADVTFAQLEEVAINYPSPARAKQWSKYYTSGPHLAGKNYSQALWTKAKMEEFGFKSEIVSYDVYVNYPKSHRMALLTANDVSDESHSFAKNKRTPEFRVQYEAKLEESIIEEDHTTGLQDRIPTFHGYSASGNVTGPLVFANYGRVKDYDTLAANNISVAGKIVIVKYGGIFRGLKVKKAQELGALGVLLYTDPGDDGGITIENGYEPYPNGPARHPESVQRGSVMYLSSSIGDPTTPGYPSLPNVPRGDPHGAIPSIPSLPISYTDALPLLKALNGRGPLGSSVEWKDGGLGYLGVKYNIGPTPPNIVVNLVNEVEYTITPMWNVITTIEGADPLEGTIIAGNHRDAWIAGGAADPNSGSAALLEMAGALSQMVKLGWKPTRQIILASWDGEEYGLIGSTEWVEQYTEWLKSNAIVYLNVDSGAYGRYYKASANPLLNSLIRKVVSKVPSPKEAPKSVGDTWDGVISSLGSGSDYTSFQDFVGIPSSDIGFSNKDEDGIYMYHSNYDSFHWMEKFGDPGFGNHAATAKIWTLMALHLSTLPVLPLNVSEYADQLALYSDEVQHPRKKPNDDTHKMLAISPEKYFEEPPTLSTQNAIADFNFTFLDTSISTFTSATSNLRSHIAALEAEILRIVAIEPPIPKWYDVRSWLRRYLLYRNVKSVNDLLRSIDREFTYEPGLDGRNQFKHVVFAPGRWTGYSGVTFPGLVEAFEDGDKERAEKWQWIIGSAVLNGKKKVCELLEKTDLKCYEGNE